MEKVDLVVATVAALTLHRARGKLLRNGVAHTTIVTSRPFRLSNGVWPLYEHRVRWLGKTGMVVAVLMSGSGGRERGCDPAAGPVRSRDNHVAGAHA
jgi:hypothetical protein